MVINYTNGDKLYDDDKLGGKRGNRIYDDDKLGGKRGNRNVIILVGFSYMFVYYRKRFL